MYRVMKTQKPFPGLRIEQIDFWKGFEDADPSYIIKCYAFEREPLVAFEDADPSYIRKCHAFEREPL